VKELDERFRLLRVRVQHGTAMPSLVVVGSAQRGDGTTYVACGLARAFAEAGHETLLLDANPRNSGIADELDMTFGSNSAKPERVGQHFSVASLFDSDERLLEDHELTRVVDHVRQNYAITIIDAPVIPGSGAALQIARIADGLLVAVRMGRRPGAADHDMKALMQPGGLIGDKAVSGIVPTRAVKHRRSGRHTVRSLSTPLVDVVGAAAARFQATSP
jgi:Mrp family chromosome partitioning ATPase